MWHLLWVVPVSVIGMPILCMATLIVAEYVYEVKERFLPYKDPK